MFHLIQYVQSLHQSDTISFKNDKNKRFSANKYSLDEQRRKWIKPNKNENNNNCSNSTGCRYWQEHKCETSHCKTLTIQEIISSNKPDD